MLASRLLRASVKKTTGLVGLDVVPNAREVLTKLYQKTLHDLQIIPEGVAYRKNVEAFTKARLAVVQSTEDIPTIESTIGCGQVEELIEQAKGELILIPEYASWKLWERKPINPTEEQFADMYDDMQEIDPAVLDEANLRAAAAKARAKQQ